MPSFEGPHWHAVDAATGDIIAKIVTNSGAHNTIYGPDGRRVYLAGLKSPMLTSPIRRTHTVIGQVGPFGHSIRPFTINGAQTRVFVNVNDLLGFEVGDITTGSVLHRVEVAGYQKGPVKRHGCPSHGIGLTPDEREIWLADGANSTLHVFDTTVDAAEAGRQHHAPRSARLDHLQPGRAPRVSRPPARSSTPPPGKLIATLTDETGRAVQSEKVVEVVFAGSSPVRTGDQFGIGRKR